MNDEPSEVIVSALRLARERVTGNDLEEKISRRMQLTDLITRAQLAPGAGLFGTTRPSAAELREALGDPDDKALRDALAGWEDSPAALEKLD